MHNMQFGSCYTGMHYKLMQYYMNNTGFQTDVKCGSSHPLIYILTTDLGKYDDYAFFLELKTERIEEKL
jgi:hypothetical protein